MLKYITLGTDCKEYFNYDGQPLPIRPLSTYEVDQIMVETVGKIHSSIFDSTIKFKLKIIDDEVELNKENYQSYLNFNAEIDYWTVYYGMKDFQPEEFSMPDYSGEFENKFEDWDEDKPKGYYIVRNMKYVHDIAKDVTNMTTRTTPEVLEILKNSNGIILATMLHRFHQPLASEAWKLTPLQTKFILYSRPDAPVEVNPEDIGFAGGTIKDLSEYLRGQGFNANGR